MTDTTSAPETDPETEGGARRLNPFIRLILGALYIVLWNVVEFLLIGIGLIQVLAQLLFGQPLGWLAGFGASLGLWARQIVEFVSGHTDRPAFPFGRWPRASREG